MPKLRLSDVIDDKKVDRKVLTSEVNAAINRLLLQKNDIEKINDEIAEDLRVIAESLNVSIFDLFTPDEKFYRLKIFERLNELGYLGSPREKLEKLLSQIPQANKISFLLLGIYATQILPERLLIGTDLEVITKLLNISLANLRELSSKPQQAISVESILTSLGISLNELSILLLIPEEFIPWISFESNTKASNTFVDRINDRTVNSHRDAGRSSDEFRTEESGRGIFCQLFGSIFRC
jgi:hypothetical protein